MNPGPGGYGNQGYGPPQQQGYAQAQQQGYAQPQQQSYAQPQGYAQPQHGYGQAQQGQHGFASPHPMQQGYGGPQTPIVTASVAPSGPQSTEGRIFLPLRILFGLALIAVGVGLGVYLKDEWNDGHRIRVKGVLLVALAPLAGLAVMASSFAKGCTRCKKELEARRYAYPAASFNWLAEQHRIGGRALEAFLQAPIELGPQVTVLQLHTCPKCESLGSIQVKQEMRGADTAVAMASTDIRPLGPDDVWIAPALRTNRQPMA